MEQARQIAVEHLAAKQLPVEVVVLDKSTLTKPYGWIFFYNSRKYVETGDINAMLGGNAPLLVLAEDGSIHPLSTAHPVQTSIARFEQERGFRSA
jgi:hypothetical protein